MTIAGEINGELRRRFAQFGRFGSPGHCIRLPHGFRAESSPAGEIVLLHESCPDYPVRIGAVALHPYRWQLGLNWDKAAGTLVKTLGLEEETTEEEITW